MHVQCIFFYRDILDSQVGMDFLESLVLLVSQAGKESRVLGCRDLEEKRVEMECPVLMGHLDYLVLKVNPVTLW